MCGTTSPLPFYSSYMMNHTINSLRTFFIPNFCYFSLSLFSSPHAQKKNRDNDDKSQAD